jgi:ATP/maltotriose-dependent transcriptional regulator MalT
MAHINRAWVGVYSNNWSLVEKDVTTAIRLVITSEEPGAFNVLAPHLTAVLLYMPKGVQRLKSYSAQVLASSEEEFVLSKVGANALMGVIYLMEGKIEDAYQSLLQARRGSDIMGGFVWLDIGIDFAILNHALINADYAGFSTYWQSRLRHFEQNAGAREYLTGFLYIKGRALAYQGRLAEASELYGQMMENENADDIPENQLVRGLMGALLMIFEGKFQQAEEILRQVSGMQLQAPHSVLFGDARVFLTFLYFKWGRTEDALAEFQVVVKDYERRSMLGLLLDEGALLQPLFKLAVDKDVCAVQARWLIETLDGARQVQPIFIHSTGETLTLREVDVFALIAQGLTNRQIANKLFIGETTVKSHTTSILRKLGVQTRTQAAARARELNLF